MTALVDPSWRPRSIATITHVETSLLKALTLTVLLVALIPAAAKGAQKKPSAVTPTAGATPFPVDEYRAATAAAASAEAPYARNRVVIVGSVVERGPKSILIMGRTVNCADQNSLGCLSPLTEAPLLVEHPRPGDILGMNTYFRGIYYFASTKVYNSVRVYVYTNPKEISATQARVAELSRRAAELGVDPASGKSLKEIAAQELKEERAAQAAAEAARARQVQIDRDAEALWQVQDDAFEKQRDAHRSEAVATKFQFLKLEAEFPEGCKINAVGVKANMTFLVRKDLPPLVVFLSEGSYPLQMKSPDSGRPSGLREDVCAFIKRESHTEPYLGARLFGLGGTLWHYGCFKDQRCALVVESSSFPPPLHPPTPTPTPIVNPFRSASSQLAVE